MTRRRLLAALVRPPDECRTEGAESLAQDADIRPDGSSPHRIRLIK